jgi:hypothetical protein
MAGNPAETHHSNDFDEISFGLSLNDDFSTVPFQQTPPSGVGTTTPFYDSSSAFSSFVLDLDVSTSLSSPSGSFTQDTPLTPATGPTTPESSTTSESSFSDPTDSNIFADNSIPGKHRCAWPNCKSKNPVFDLPCKLR